MALMRWPTELHGIPLSERTQWLLFAPTWMLFPTWSRKVLSQPIVDYVLRSELRT